MKAFKMGPLQKRWVRRLKAHPERQLKGSLGKGNPKNYKACCLGEAGIMLGNCSFDNKGILRDTNSRNPQVLSSYKDIGLRDSRGVTLSDSKGLSQNLADLNDDRYHTWTDIAYLIEAAPELFFTGPK